LREAVLGTTDLDDTEGTLADARLRSAMRKCRVSVRSVLLLVRSSDEISAYAGYRSLKRLFRKPHGSVRLG
jgi:hypothetical protein